MSKKQSTRSRSTTSQPTIMSVVQHQYKTLVLTLIFVLQLFGNSFTAIAMQDEFDDTDASSEQNTLLNEDISSTDDESTNDSMFNIDEASNDVTFENSETIDIGGDFTYYIDGEEYYCNFDEINDVIATARSGTLFYMNNDVVLNSSMTFGSSANCEINLNGHTLSAQAGYRIIKIASGANVTIRNGSIAGADITKSATGSARDKDGAGIYVDGTLHLEDIYVDNNIGRYGAGIHVTGNGNLTGANIFIRDNTATTLGGGLYLDDGATVNVTNLVVSSSHFKNSRSTGGGIYVSDNATLIGSNVKVINNAEGDDVETGGIYASNNANIILDNVLIQGNHSSRDTSRAAGGFSCCGGNVSLTNVVIKENYGPVGGLNITQTSSSSSVNFTITGMMAIYNNVATVPYEGDLYANDILITQNTYQMSISIPAANTMNDSSGMDFSDYYWAHSIFDGSKETYEESKKSIELGSVVSRVTHLYNASNEQSRIVAERITSSGTVEQFTTLSVAINAAENGDTIRLVSAVAIDETVTVTNKTITIDLNERKWYNDNIALTVGEGASVTITGEGKISNIEYNGDNLILNSDATVGTIHLGTGKSIQAGANFPTDKLTETLTIKLSDEDIDKIETQDVTLVRVENELSEDVIKKIALLEAGSLVIVVADENGNIVARKMKGVFVNGISGSDENDGFTANSPVKTFTKAKEIQTRENLDSIFVTGTITVNTSEEWSLSDGVSMLRYKEYLGYLVDVKAELTLRNITIDGQGDNVHSTCALINVESGATLKIKDNVNLTNNNNTASSYTKSGGAIYCYNGCVIIYDGRISKNSSLYGGGIHLYGPNAKIILEGGSIDSNKAVNISNETGAGGGIALMNGASMVWNGGEVSNNQATDSQGIGGGIMLGLPMVSSDSIGSTLVMKGGILSDNSADINGGGLYIQCDGSTATLYVGDIKNNSCSKKAGIVSGAVGAYGGGGIYVNGGRSGYEDGKLYIPTSVFISGNIAKGKNGAGIAGCGTSTINVYPDAATIYGNDGSQIYADSTERSGYGTTAKANISDIALGGGINHWSDENGEKSSDELKELLPGTILELNNPNAENLDTSGTLASVKITGNYSGTRGGGIGSNGYVQIGEEPQNEPDNPNDPIVTTVTSVTDKPEDPITTTVTSVTDKPENPITTTVTSVTDKSEDPITTTVTSVTERPYVPNVTTVTGTSYRPNVTTTSQTVVPDIDETEYTTIIEDEIIDIISEDETIDNTDRDESTSTISNDSAIDNGSSDDNGFGDADDEDVFGDSDSSSDKLTTTAKTGNISIKLLITIMMASLTIAVALFIIRPKNKDKF